MSIHQIEYDKELFRDIIATAFPGKKLQSFSKIENGIMNLVLDVHLQTGEQYIFKLSDLPKKYGIEKEAHIMKIVKQHGVPVAEIVWSDYSQETWDFEIVIMQKLPGKPAQQTWHKLTKKQQLYVAKQAGAILGIIHRIQFDKPAQIAGTNFNYYPTLQKYLDKTVYKDLQTAREMKFIEPKLLDTIKTLYEDHTTFIEQTQKFTLCHLDYHLGHIMIDENAKITGIIDWGFADILPAEAEFFKPHRWIFDKGVHIKEVFIKAYALTQDIPDQFEERIRFYRLLFDLKFIERLVKTNQQSLAEEYVIKLKEHIGVLQHSKSLN